MSEAHPNRRHADRCKIIRIWEKISPYWQMVTGGFAAVGGLIVIVYTVTAWVTNVEAKQVTTLETIAGHSERIGALEEKVTDIKVMKQRIEDIALFMGVPKRKEPRTEK